LDLAERCNLPFPTEDALRKAKQAFSQREEELPVGFMKWAEHVTQQMRQAETAERSVRIRLGGDFILDEPEIIPAIWGQGERVLWPEGEGMMITGHQGVGKTTVAQQLVLHMIELRAGDFLGLPVIKSDRPVLYLAMDRGPSDRRGRGAHAGAPEFLQPPRAQVSRISSTSEDHSAH
jgi:RecA-family ATPase